MKEEVFAVPHEKPKPKPKKKEHKEPVGMHVILDQNKVASIYAWGNNKYDQLGVSKLAVVPKPMPLILTDPTSGHHMNNQIKVEKISCGHTHTLFLTRSGLVFQIGRFCLNALKGE